MRVMIFKEKIIFENSGCIEDVLFAKGKILVGFSFPIKSIPEAYQEVDEDDDHKTVMVDLHLRMLRLEPVKPQAQARKGEAHDGYQMNPSASVWQALLYTLLLLPV